MDTQRLILFVALSAILLLLWQAWVERSAPVAAGTAVSPASPAQREVPAAPTAPTAAGKEVPRPAAVPAVEALERGERVVVVTDLLRAEIDTLGGDLRHLELRKYPVAIDQPNNAFVLMNDQGKELFVAQSGLIGPEGRALPNHRTPFTTEQRDYRLADGQDIVQVRLHWNAPDGVRYTKTYTFRRASYLVDVEFNVDNRAKEAWAGYLYAQFQRTPPPDTGGGLGYLQQIPTYLGAAYYTPTDKYRKVSFADMDKQNLRQDAPSGWVAMLQHYFVGAWLPAPDGQYQFYSRVFDGARYSIGYKTAAPLTVAPGASGRVVSRLYAGPKEQDALENHAEGLVLTVDYGWLTPIAAPLFWVLEFIHRWVGNWGWAIIILTVLIKLAFFPLSAASYKSMAKMKKLQPRLQTLKERYGDDKQKLNQAMMELYKTEKINPLGGCLPILVQIPVFIALYWVLLESVEMRQASFVLWLKDLSSPDPYYVLPLVMGATMLAQQFLTPSPLDPIQKKVMMAMPVVFTAFFLFFPAGLVLYWVVNNALSIAQQWQITRLVEAKGR